MELRPRSRSNTPLLRRSHEKEVGNHVTRSTRRTVKSIETVITEGKSRTSNTQKNRYITSDYSSEEGEGFVSSSGMDNIKNEIKEDMALSVNGNRNVSALKLYKQAGEYWNKFPKTDYTYSRHSKDRVELAPGVVAMPNMSRRSLHSAAYTEGIVSNKETNTEMITNDETSYNLFAQRLKPQSSVYANNNENDSFVIHRKTIHEVTFFEKIVFYVLTVCHFILYPLFYLYHKQQSLFLWVGKMFHRIASKVMLWDTWVLQKNVSPEKKLYGIATLCLLPLLLFGGLWILLGIISGLNTWMASLPPASHLVSHPEGTPKVIDVSLKDSNNFDFDDVNFQRKLVRFIEGMGFFKKDLETGINPGDVAKGLSNEQLSVIADIAKKDIIVENNVNVDDVIKKLLENPQIISFNEELQLRKELETLQKEIELIRENIEKREKLLMEIQFQNKQENMKLSVEMRRRCRHSFIQIEGFVLKVLRDLLGTPHQEDISKWLHSMFLAKQDLEGKITNLTQNLKSDFDKVIENNAKVIMDDVSRKLSSKLENPNFISTVDDDRVREIVSEALAVYDADKTGLVDYAMESAGGQILSTRCTETYQVKTAVVSIFGISVWYPSNSPRTAITPGEKPGECWAFQNFPGFLVIKLFGPVKITSFSMEHLSKKLATNNRVDSAPRDFEVYGLMVENDLEPLLLGKYKYSSDGEPLQFFPVENEFQQAFELVELRILSNHGNPNYTCLYRFRVHGELQNGPT